MQVGLHRGAGQNPRLEMKSPLSSRIPFVHTGVFLDN